MKTFILFKNKVDFMQYVLDKKATSKAELSRLLGISRPAFYVMVERLGVESSQLNVALAKNRELLPTKTDRISFIEMLQEAFTGSKIYAHEYNGKEVFYVEDIGLFRNKRGKAKPLPEMTSKGVIFCNWMHAGERFTVKKSDLIYMIENDLNSVPNGFRTSADGKALHRTRTKESDMALVDKLEQADDAEVVRLVRAYFGK